MCIVLRIVSFKCSDDRVMGPFFSIHDALSALHEEDFESQKLIRQS